MPCIQKHGKQRRPCEGLPALCKVYFLHENSFHRCAMNPVCVGVCVQGSGLVHVNGLLSPPAGEGVSEEPAVAAAVAGAQRLVAAGHTAIKVKVARRWVPVGHLAPHAQEAGGVGGSVGQ